ncbi:MAG TPA: acetate--CoA ligase family protein [Desulfitobacteriaceae bacterium]|nr:acetate--CoA ligase family protein [Desulfitobacteriaceae bacterium]
MLFINSSPVRKAGQFSAGNDEVKIMGLEHLLKPKAIAIVGASESPFHFGNTVAVNALESEKNTDIYFINPKRDTVLGKPTYKSLSGLPLVPDLVVLATPRATVLSLLKEAGELGSRAAVVFASGYSEEGTETGRADEAELKAIARKYGMKVMGPNCIGFINNLRKIKVLGFTGAEFDMDIRKTGAAIFAQSGKITADLAGCPYLDISYVFSMGNCAALTIEEMFEHVVEENEVNILGIYLEGVKDAPRFIRCLSRAYELNKPVVIHAAGLSKLGAKSTVSHTGSLAGNRAAYEAVFKKYNVIMVENKDEFLSAVNLLACWQGRMPKRANFAGFNESGGDNAIMADMCEKYGVHLPALEPESKDKLEALLPSFATPSNPLDAVGGSVTGALNDQVALYRTFGQDPNIDALLFGAIPFSVGDPLNDRIGKMMLRYAREEGSVPMLVMPSMEDTRDPRWREKLKEQGIAILGCSDIGYKVLGKISRYIEDKYKRTLAHAVPERQPDAPSVYLTEFDSKQALAEIGMPMPRHAVVRSKEQLLEILAGFKFPVVLKISSVDILHKTDAGGVKLNLQSREEALSAYDSIMKSCAAYDPKARLDGIFVQEMAGAGTEMILGISSDAQFGPLLMIGMGGVFVEVFKDVALYPCPLGKDEALEMIKSLKVYKLLKGYRGSKTCDIDALADLMVRLSQFAADNKEVVKELDLNPVFVYPEGEGLAVVDALLIKYQE